MNIGIVLSGGMAKGAYQIGALKALNEILPVEKIKYMSCSSIGVLNGYAYATNQLNKAQTMWKSICCENSRLFVTKILRSTTLQKNINDLFLCDSNFPPYFYCSLLDISHRNIAYKNISAIPDLSVLSYLKASVAMPIYNRAVYIDNTPYFDGAMVDNIPVYPLLKHKLDYIVCIYFDDVYYKFENTYFDNKIIKITFPAENRLKQSVMFTSEGIENMINLGYTKTREILNITFKNGIEDTEYIYDIIENQNKKKCNMLRITGDVLVTGLNKFAQKFSKKTIF